MKMQMVNIISLFTLYKSDRLYSGNLTHLGNESDGGNKGLTGSVTIGTYYFRKNPRFALSIF